MLIDAIDEDGNKILKDNGEPKKKLSFVKKESLDYPYKLIVIDELSMVNDDTIKLLRECNSGIKMGVSSIDDVIDRVKNRSLQDILAQSRREQFYLE